MRTPLKRTKQAIAAKPDVPGYYNNLGNVLARAERIEDAKAAVYEERGTRPTERRNRMAQLWDQPVQRESAWRRPSNPCRKPPSLIQKMRRPGISWERRWFTR